MNLIELKEVIKEYRQGGFLGGKRKIQVLTGVNLAVAPGQCLGLLGASGCGKSTTGRLVLGLERPDRGQVLYKGQNLKKMNFNEKQHWRRNCQVVFQNSHGAVNPGHQAWDIVTEALTNFEPAKKSELKERAAVLLQRVGLSPDDLHKLPHQFSGGELQRLCIARALALNPEFILLDEAVSSLDMLTQNRVLDLLAQLKEESGVAYIFISHDLRVLLKICDSLAIMGQGRITSYIANLADLEKPGAVDDPTLKALAGAVLGAEPPSV